jgi:hypothetical protein
MIASGWITPLSFFAIFSLQFSIGSAIFYRSSASAERCDRIGRGVSDFITKMLKPSTKQPSAIDIPMLKTKSVSIWFSFFTSYDFEWFIVPMPNKLEPLRVSGCVYPAGDLCYSATAYAN